MSLINFIAEYDLLATQTDLDDADSDSDLVPMVGSVIFTPVYPDNSAAILSADYSPRPTGIKFLPISGYLEDGQMLTAPGGAIGVRLPANDPVLDIAQLVYRVDFNVRKTSGEKVSIAAGYFAAPTSGGALYLARVLKPTLALAIAAGPSQPDVLDLLVFSDNGDSTWTATTTGEWCATVDEFTDNGDSTIDADLDGPADCDTFVIYNLTLANNGDSTFYLALAGS